MLFISLHPIKCKNFLLLFRFGLFLHIMPKMCNFAKCRIIVIFALIIKLNIILNY